MGYTVDNVRQKFTSYERDNESDLDFAQARYYSSKLGRFYSVDPENYQAFSDISNPQSWNAYAYVNNNPCSNADPTGTCICLGQRFSNWRNGYGFDSDETVETQYQKRLALVQAAERIKATINGNPIDVNSMSRRQIWDNAEIIRQYVQNNPLEFPETQVEVSENGTPTSTPEINISPFDVPGGGGTRRTNDVRSQMPKAPKSLQKVGRAINWGNAEQGALNRLQTLTRQEVINSGVTKAEAEAAREFYRGVAKADPLNKAAPVRAELMQKVVDFLSGP